MVEQQSIITQYSSIDMRTAVLYVVVVLHVVRYLIFYENTTGTYIRYGIKYNIAQNNKVCYIQKL